MIGEMRQRLILQKESRSEDGGGGAALSWTTVATVWASIEPVRAYEKVTGEKPVGSITHRITTRYEAAISPQPDAAMRFIWGSRTFNIRGVRNSSERNRFLLIDAEEGVAV